MLAIRMQRLGRKGHPTYRVVVQDSRQAPTSGKYVAMLGSYDPHTKVSTLVKDKAQQYLNNGAQPSDRVVRLFQSEGIDLPSWVKVDAKSGDRGLKNPDKLRKNRPVEEEAPSAEAEAPTEGSAPEAEAVVEEAPVAEDAPAVEEATEEAK